MKDFFKISDFWSGLDFKYLSNDYILERINKKFNELIESWTVVYFENATNRIKHCSKQKTNTDTHKARLVFIEPIVKEPCKNHVPKLKSTQPVHIPASGDYFGTALLTGCSIVCVNCSVELQATWSEKK